jgi:hypothetical protein
MIFLLGGKQPPCFGTKSGPTNPNIQPLYLGKTAITFAYEVGLKSFLYEKVSTRKVTSKFNNLWSFRQILESQNSKGKIDFFALLYFQFFLNFLFLDQNLYWIKLLD